MIEAIIGKIIGSLGGLLGVVVTVIIQFVIWFFGTFILGGIVWLIYALTNKRRKA
ncbi:MAG: hypothetical protein KA140_00525 [Caldisericia bacterium]|nr:hypothetical protein [Caldisericia bacterium]